MAAAVLVRGGGRLFLVDPDTRVVQALGPDPGREDEALAPTLSERLRQRLAGPPTVRWVLAGDPPLREVLARSGVPVELAGLTEFRAARELLPWPSFRSRRADLLEEARRRFAEQLSSPEETLVALAREEERVERVRAREQGAAEHWMAPSTGPLSEYAGDWTGFRTALERHHDALVRRLEREAERTVPNLSIVVGPRVAARLVAAAGGVAALARISGSRLQLLGARRRAGGDRGPKYGLLARTVLASDVPPAARGAYARSLAALAAIAARADAITGADLGAFLADRRERRRRALRGRTGP